ncbi:MAG: zf-TFIIB domain-containing protein [Fimbriimonadaceae bacterium]
MERICPDCDQPLVTENVLDFQVDVCAKCAGLWFDDGELTKLSKAGWAEMDSAEDRFVPTVEPSQSDQMRSCPACRKPMEAFRYLYSSPVTLDSCPSCLGIWVEDGELRQMMLALGDAQSQPVNPALSSQLKIVAIEDRHRDRISHSKGFARAMRLFSLRRPYVR